MLLGRPTQRDINRRIGLALGAVPLNVPVKRLRGRRAHTLAHLDRADLRGVRRAQTKHDRLSEWTEGESPYPADQSAFLDDLLLPAERDLPEHVKDGVAMFRTVARELAPGRTVTAQIHTVARALYGTVSVGLRRTKACCHREAGRGTVLDFKYRFESWQKKHRAWRQRFVARQEAAADETFKDIAKRLERLEDAVAQIRQRPRKRADR